MTPLDLEPSLLSLLRHTMIDDIRHGVGNTQEVQQEEEELCGIGLRFSFRAGMSEVHVT